MVSNMEKETLIGLQVLSELKVRGGIATLRVARKGHKCCECGLPIELGEPHYCIYIGGAGLGNLKFPDRKHVRCVIEGNRNRR